jgi:hypothetical protein
MKYTSIRRTVVRYAVIVLALGAFAVEGQTADSSSRTTFAGHLKESSFDFKWQQGMIFVPVRVNGSRPLSFVLDSGSTRTLIDRSVAASLGLKVSGSGSLQGAGAGRILIDFVRDVRLSLPGLDSAGYELSTADLKPLESTLGVKVDGILGYELFSRFVVGLDYESKRVTITAPEAFRVPGGAVMILPLELRDKWPFVKGELVFSGTVTVQDSFLIDTGSSDAVDHPVVMNLQSKTSGLSGVGLGKPAEGATARAASFRLGGYEIDSPVVSCCGATDATSRLIGSEILRRFTVTLDYPSSRMFIAPNSAYGGARPRLP